MKEIANEVSGTYRLTKSDHLRMTIEYDPIKDVFVFWMHGPVPSTTFEPIKKELNIYRFTAAHAQGDFVKC